MALQQPKSMDECVYFTNRSLGEKGKVKAWAFRRDCPKCKKALMGKPRDPKTGKPKIRAQEYVCQECGHTVEKKEYEETLTVCVEYTCPHCNHQGEAEVPFKRKKVRIFDPEKQKKVSVDAVRFPCDKCGDNIDVTKKMK